MKALREGRIGESCRLRGDFSSSSGTFDGFVMGLLRCGNLWPEGTSQESSSISTGSGGLIPLYTLWVSRMLNRAKQKFWSWNMYVFPQINRQWRCRRRFILKIIGKVATSGAGLRACKIRGRYEIEDAIRGGDHLPYSENFSGS